MSEVPASCIAWDEDLSALIDEELSAEREAELRAHLDACSRCTLRIEELCNVDLALAGLAAPEVSSDLRQRLAARMAADADRPVGASEAAPVARKRTVPPEHRPRWSAARLAALGAAAAAVLLAAWVAVRSDAPLAPEPPIAGVAPAPELPEAAPNLDALKREVDALERKAPSHELELPAAQIAREEPAAPTAPLVAPPEGVLEVEPPVEMAEVGLPELADLEEEDVALLVELEAVEDFDVIANLELLERFLDAEAAGGAG